MKYTISLAKKFSGEIKRYTSNLDSCVALILAFGSITGIFVSLYFVGLNVRIVTALLALFMGAVLYLMRRDSVDTETGHVPSRISLMEYRILLNILFLLLFVISTLSIFETLYDRPPIYFVLISLMSGLVVLETRISPSYIILPKIVLIGLSLQLGILYVYPSIVGVDAPAHFGLVKELLSTGKIAASATGIYEQFPGFYFSVVTNMLVLGTGYKDALTVGIAVPYTLVTMFSVFLLGRKLFNEKVGLIGALISVTFPFSLWLGYIGAPITFGIMSIPLLLYLFLQRKTSYYVLGIFIFALLWLSHPLAMAIFLVIAVGLFLGSLVYKRYPKSASLFPFALVLTICLSRWMFFSGDSMSRYMVESSSQLYNQISSLIGGSTSFLDSTYVSSQSLSSADYLFEGLNTLGVSLFISFFIIGLLWLLSQPRSQQNTEYLGASVLLTVVALGATLLSLINIIPHRWLATFAMLVAPLGAIGISKLSSKKIAPIILVITLIFLMITNSVANMDSPIYAKATSVRYAYTRSEMAAARYAYESGGVNNLYSDWSYFGCFRAYPFELGLIVKQSAAGYLLLRDYIIDRAFYIKDETIEGGIGISTMNERDTLLIQDIKDNLALIYVNSQVDIYFARNMSNIILPNSIDVVHY